MKFIFVDSFDLIWNGKTARYKNGVSGSHSALFYLAEGLASQGTDVEIVSIKNNLIEDTYLNVKYTNYDNFHSSDCDYIVTVNNLSTLRILDKIVSFKKLLILTENDLYEYDNFFTIDKEKVLICYISEFAKRNILNVQPFLNDYNNILLYNSFDLRDIPETTIKENSLCYFACIERGYKLAVEVLNKLDNYSMYANTYYEQPLPNLNNKIIFSENNSKNTILNCVNKSKYFVYPLINLDNNCIHYDTFGYVVLEALLTGTIVIAPKIGVFEELYGDAVCYIDTDDIIPQEYLLNWKNHNSNFGYPLLDRYVEKIKLLDENDELRTSYIEKGFALRDKFENTNISIKLLDILKKKETDKLQNHLFNLSNERLLPQAHINYLIQLKNNGFEPRVIYDIGSCALHWTNEAKKLWPDATYILFDAFSPVEFLYKDDYHIGVLSDKDDVIVKFYQNDYFPGGNSYYREIGCENGKYFPENKYIEKITKTLDTVVKERGFPLPDFVKIDVQGSEIDIIKGGVNTLSNVEKLIVELQHMEYNQGAMLCGDSVPIIEKTLNMKCVAPLFQNNGCDGDYGFEKV
jgi:glycosyltransferase involved in cell wall biosynthesis